MDILLTGWWWDKWESASSTFWFQPVWGVCACGQHVVNFSHLVEVSVSVKQLKDNVMCIPWGGTRTLPRGCTLVSWLLFPYLHIPPLPQLATVWIFSLELREGHGGCMKPISCNQEMGDTERLLCPGAPQGPSRYQWEGPQQGHRWGKQGTTERGGLQRERLQCSHHCIPFPSSGD